VLGPVQVDAYEWIDGMEQLLQDLQQAGVELHAMSNYPVWYKHVNQKLGVDRCASL
jgi:phosphoglycolate phosphatase-like HAD superfamily hydrolase